MPRFSTMTSDEAQALVNYFIAVDRLQDPALGVEYHVPVPAQRSAAEQTFQRQEYQSKVEQVNPAKAAKADYYAVGWNMLTDNNLCLKCHDIGNLKAGGATTPAAPGENGPPLAQAVERLRPEYIQHWVSNPPRILPYTLMPQYDPFFANPHYGMMQSGLRQPVVKASLQKLPLLTAPFPAALLGPLNDAVYNQLQDEFVLTPQEKVRAVRDAIITWGYLENPPPAAVKAGSRADIHGKMPK
jgi:hypothetical protein